MGKRNQGEELTMTVGEWIWGKRPQKCPEATPLFYCKEDVDVYEQMKIEGLLTNVLDQIDDSVDVVIVDSLPHVPESEE